MAALRAWPRTRVEHLRAWVLTIAHRKALDDHRSRARRPAPVGAAADAPSRPGRARTPAPTACGGASATCRPSSAPRCCCATPPTCRTARSRRRSGARRRPPAARRTRGSSDCERSTPHDRPASPPDHDPAGAAAAAARFAAAARPDVAYAAVDSPVGRLLAATTARGLVALRYEDDDGGRDAVLERLAARVSPRILEAPARLDDVRRELEEYFAGERRAIRRAVDWALVGGFGRRVLAATAEIPFGETRSYAQVAQRAGNARASRATGNALGANPIPIVVPCHRVLRPAGPRRLHRRTERKQALLLIEGVAV